VSVVVKEQRVRAECALQSELGSEGDWGGWERRVEDYSTTMGGVYEST
jgi:hypothetical protein